MKFRMVLGLIEKGLAIASLVIGMCTAAVQLMIKVSEFIV